MRIAWWEGVLPKIGFRALSERTRPARLRRIAASFRSLAVTMGGVLIKVGQFLSARLDVLPREITGELTGLQDEVGAEPFEAIRRVVERELGATIEERFSSFGQSPIASASIGQVHRATLPASAPEAGRFDSIVVKVQRPDIEEIVRIDLAALRQVGDWVRRFRVVRRHMDVPALIEEFSRSLLEEIDYVREGENAERFARNFSRRPDVRVPAVVRRLSTKRVLTLQDVGSWKITDYKEMDEGGIDRKGVARRLVDVYLQQLFEDGFFHADPHPGNLFVQPSPSTGGAFKLTFVDFGMVGSIPPDTFSALRDALIAVGTRDAARLIDTFKRLDLLLPEADLELLERATREVFERFWGKPSSEIMRMSQREVDAFVKEFGDLLYDMPFQMPENFILLGRCVAILSGMASGLDPDFNVWNSIAPYAQKLVAEDAGEGFEKIMSEISTIGRLLFALPKRVDTLVTRIEEGRLEVRIPELRGHVTRLERAARKLGASIVSATLLLSATVLLVSGHEDLAIGTGSIAGVLFIWLLFGR